MKNLIRTLLLTLTTATASIAHAADGPQKTVQTFYETFINGETNKTAALVYLPPEAVQKGVTTDTVRVEIDKLLQEIRAEMAEKGSSVVSITTGEIEYTNAARTEVKVSVIRIMRDKDGDTDEEYETIALIKTDGGWKVQPKNVSERLIEGP